MPCTVVQYTDAVNLSSKNLESVCFFSPAIHPNSMRKTEDVLSCTGLSLLLISEMQTQRLFASCITEKNYPLDFHETWWKGVSWAKEELITFWSRSRSSTSLGGGMCSLSAFLVHFFLKKCIDLHCTCPLLLLAYMSLSQHIWCLLFLQNVNADCFKLLIFFVTFIYSIVFRIYLIPKFKLFNLFLFIYSYL